MLSNEYCNDMKRNRYIFLSLVGERLGPEVCDQETFHLEAVKMEEKIVLLTSILLLITHYKICIRPHTINQC